MRKLIDARALAEQLAISVKSVYRLTAIGQLPHVRVGRSVRFDPIKVARILKIESDDKRENS